MRLKNDFIAQEIDGVQYLVPVGAEQFSGMLRNNKTAAFIVDCLKEETTEETVVDAMCEKYDAPREKIAEDVKGDKVSVRTVKELENSSNNADFDREGALVRDVELISGNVVKNILGTRQYSQYLGLENSFIPGNFVAEGGTRTDEELRSGSVLEIVEFSDFQVDPMSGDLAGEIRLGYWHDGNQVKIVSGGSISGNMKELAKDMYLSKNQAQYNNYKIPSLTRIEGVQITGISE